MLAQAMSEANSGNVIPLTAAAGIALCLDHIVKSNADTPGEQTGSGSLSDGVSAVEDGVLEGVLDGVGYSVLEAAGGPCVLGAVAEALIRASEVRPRHFEALIRVSEVRPRQARPDASSTGAGGARQGREARCAVDSAGARIVQVPDRRRRRA